MNKFVRTESHTGSKFSKTTLGLLCTRVIVVMQLYCSFFAAALDGATANRQIPDRIFWSIFYQFEEGYRRQLRIDLAVVFTCC